MKLFLLKLNKYFCWMKLFLLKLNKYFCWMKLFLLKLNKYFCWMKLFLLKLNKYFCWMKLFLLKLNKYFCWMKLFLLKLNKYFCWMKIISCWILQHFANHNRSSFVLCCRLLGSCHWTWLPCLLFLAWWISFGCRYCVTVNKSKLRFWLCKKLSHLSLSTVLLKTCCIVQVTVKLKCVVNEISEAKFTLVLQDPTSIILLINIR